MGSARCPPASTKTTRYPGQLRALPLQGRADDDGAQAAHVRTVAVGLLGCWVDPPVLRLEEKLELKLVADRDAGGVTYRNGRLELSGCEERVPVQRPQVHAQPLVERDGGDVVVGGWCPLAHQRFSHPIAIVPGDVPDHGR